ncbi:MAG: glycosyltransferase [Candidatus Omnitrophota bacterium]|nr:MAG: glycosyltransferase [Candidatus Omnitrophota bacterium]
MKILQVIHSANPAGGGPIESAQQIGMILQGLGHMVEVASLDSPGAPWVSKFPLKLNMLGPSYSKYGYSPRFVPWLIANSKKYDAVVVRGVWQYSSFGVWRALHKTGTPYFVYPHGMLDPWFKYKYPLKHLRKILYWFWGEYRVLRDAKAVLFTSEQERILANKSFRPYKCNEVVVKYGTALPPQDQDAKRAIFFKEFPDLADKRIFLFLGRIHPKKGCDLLIKAFAQIAREDSSLHLVIAGPDQIGWQKKLQRLCEKLGVSDKVSWPAMLSGDLKWGAFYAAEAFILPSHQENFGIAVAEALGCGVPVLITNKVNIWREIEADGAGLVANDNLEGIIILLKGWLALQQSKRQDMQKKSKSCFIERFEIHKTAQSLVEMLRAMG